MFPKVLRVAILFWAAAVPVLAQDQPAKPNPIESMPGFVDFDVKQFFGDSPSSVEIYLEAPLLKIMSGATKNEDPDLAKLLDGLALIRVNIFPAAPADTTALKAKVDEATAKLEADQWSRAVRVREENQAIDIYLLTSESGNIAGLTAFILGPQQESVFINIVGDFSPENLGDLAAKFMDDNIDASIFEQLGEDDDPDPDPDSGDSADADDDNAPSQTGPDAATP